MSSCYPIISVRIHIWEREVGIGYQNSPPNCTAVHLVLSLGTNLLGDLRVGPAPAQGPYVAGCVFIGNIEDINFARLASGINSVLPAPGSHLGIIEPVQPAGHLRRRLKVEPWVKRIAETSRIEKVVCTRSAADELLGTRSFGNWGSGGKGRKDCLL